MYTETHHFSCVIRQQLTELPVTESAPILLGRCIEFGVCKFQIVEVEAYGGSEDPGSHAYRGVTPRTQVMFETIGHSYIYFTYGNHWMLNVTARPIGEPGAILIRAGRPLAGADLMASRRPKAKTERDYLSGPGKIAAALDLTGQHNGIDLLSPNSPLRLTEGRPALRIWQGTRIGIAPGRGDDLIRRYVDLDAAEWASQPRPKAEN